MVIRQNDNCANCEIQGYKEKKGVVYIVMCSDDHYDDVVTVFSNLDDAMKYCEGEDRLYINVSNVF